MYPLLSYFSIFSDDQGIYEQRSSWFIIVISFSCFLNWHFRKGELSAFSLILSALGLSDSFHTRGTTFRSTEKFPASCSGFQSGDERVLLSFFSFLILKSSQYLCIFLVLTLVWCFHVFSVFFINLENRKYILFSGVCTEVLLFSFILSYFLIAKLLLPWLK